MSAFLRITYVLFIPVRLFIIYRCLVSWGGDVLSGAVSPPTEKTTSVSLLVFGPIRPTWQTTKTESKRPSSLEVTMPFQ